MPVQTRSTRVKAPAISDPDTVPVEVLSINKKATLNLSGRVGFDRPLEGSSVNHENDYYKILKFINKSKFTFTDDDNEHNKELVHKCNVKYKCALCVDSFHSSLTHRKYVTKCDDKNINTLNCFTSNCIYLITCCRCGLQYVGKTFQSLRDRFSGHRTGMKNPLADNRCKILSKHFGVDLCRNANYIVNIIEKLSGSGRHDNGIPIPGVTVERQKKGTK